MLEVWNEADAAALEFLNATLRFDPAQRVPVTEAMVLKIGIESRDEALTLSYVSQLYCPEVGESREETCFRAGRACARATGHLGLRVRTSEDQHPSVERGAGRSA